MIFGLDVLPAKEGDCLILHYGSKKNPGLIVIDGGPTGVYSPHLKTRLENIRSARIKNKILPDVELLPIDLLMVSHIDDDHIVGLIDLIREVKEGMIKCSINQLWYNTFDDIVEKLPEQLKGLAGFDGEINVEGVDPDVAKILASVKKGRKLRDDAKGLNIEINSMFGAAKDDQPKLIMATPQSEKIFIGDEDTSEGIYFTVAGPMFNELDKLQKKHDETPVPGAASFSDDSITNLSSLVLLAEAGPDAARRRILLTGDARGDKILEGLKLVKLLEEGGTMHVDILKMPHHGSNRNMNEDFLKVITADHYVFSGNGVHGNPERETLEWLWNARGDKDYTVHLTYPIEKIDENRKAEMIEKKKEWVPKEHSLVSFFNTNENKKFKEKLKIVGANGPHVINLFDEEKVDF